MVPNLLASTFMPLCLCFGSHWYRLCLKISVKKFAPVSLYFGTPTLFAFGAAISKIIQFFCGIVCDVAVFGLFIFCCLLDAHRAGR